MLANTGACGALGQLLRTAQYALLLAGSSNAGLRRRRNPHSLQLRLADVSDMLSRTRTVGRLFDGPGMVRYALQCGTFRMESDTAVRWLSILGNVADVLFYPLEHIAWLADVRLLRAKSLPWWYASDAAWAVSLTVSILRSLRRLHQTRVEYEHIVAHTKPPARVERLRAWTARRRALRLRLLKVRACVLCASCSQSLLILVYM